METQLARMEPVPIRLVWPHEEHNFTPWLADNFDYLNDALDLDMEVIGQEEDVLGAGRADIIARSGSDVVIIENQLENSDDDHFVRMLHYAANRGATQIVWVAGGFTEKHQEILGWLNRMGGIDIYCVEVSAWRIADAVAPMFRQVVPSNWQAAHTPAERIERLEYRAYYRPLMLRLAEAGLVQVPEPGWDVHASFRWFSTELPDVYFGLVYGYEDNKTQAFLLANSDADKQPAFEALWNQRSAIEEEMGMELEWVEEENGDAWVGISTSGSLSDGLSERAVTLEWMWDNLTALRKALTPYL